MFRFCTRFTNLSHLHVSDPVAPSQAGHQAAEERPQAPLPPAVPPWSGFSAPSEHSDVAGEILLLLQLRMSVSIERNMVESESEREWNEVEK